MKSSNITASLLLALILAGVHMSCSSKDKYVKCEGLIWNTLYHITYRGPETLQDSIMPTLEEVGRSLSVFDKNSLVTKLNANDGVEADSHLTKVYEASMRVHELSEGLFDPTVGPLIDAWGFGLGHVPNSDTLAIDSIRTFVGLRKTHIKGSRIFKHDTRIRFNFSAIAKGYGCDAVGEMFRRNGVEDYMIEIGGELTLSGQSPSGHDWKIAVDAPVEGKNPGEETALILNLTDVGIATSGNYRNFRNEDNGAKSAHTISPITGRPFISEILSATVIAPSCMEADALATACMAGTPAEARTLISKTQCEGLLILPDTIWMSPGFSKYIEKEN